MGYSTKDRIEKTEVYKKYQREFKKKWYLANQDAWNNYHKEWRKNNREKSKAYSHSYYLKNKEEIRRKQIAKKKAEVG